MGRVLTADSSQRQGRPRGHAISADEATRTHDGAQRSDPQTSDPLMDAPTTTISLATEAFTRRAAGRRSVSDTAYSVVGDDAIARRVLEALVVTH